MRAAILCWYHTTSSHGHRKASGTTSDGSHFGSPKPGKNTLIDFSIIQQTNAQKRPSPEPGSGEDAAKSFLCQKPAPKQAKTPQDISQLFGQRTCPKPLPLNQVVMNRWAHNFPAKKPPRNPFFSRLKINPIRAAILCQYYTTSGRGHCEISSETSGGGHFGSPKPGQNIPTDFLIIRQANTPKRPSPELGSGEDAAIPFLCQKMAPK